MMNRAEWVDEIKTMLGYPIVDIEITDDMIEKQITKAIKKVIPYLNSVEIFETSTKVTKFTDKLVYAVVRVSSTQQSSYVTGLDSSLYGSYFIYTNNSENLNRNLVSNQIYNYYANEISETVDAVGFRLIGDTLYIDGGQAPYTVEAITEQSVRNMPENYLTWCFEYSLALVKIILGTIRSKVKITGSPVELDGADMKSEGTTKITDLEAKLGTMEMCLFYATR